MSRLTILFMGLGCLGSVLMGVQIHQRLDHQAACLSELEDIVSPSTPATMKGNLLAAWERECP